MKFEHDSTDDLIVKNIQKYLGISVAIIIGLIVVFGSMFTINAGERGVLSTFGNPSEKVYSEGLHFKIPIVQQVYKFDIKTQTLNFDSKQGVGDNSEYSSMFAASKDLQDVQVAVVANYHIDGTKVVSMYKTYGTQHYYNVNIIEPIVREVVKSTAAKYTAEELVTQREKFQADVSTALEGKFLEKDAILEKSNIVNFQFSNSFSQAIEAKVTAEQNALAAKNKLEQVNYEAQQKVSEARGKADAMKLEITALQENPQILQLRMIEKWDGKLSLVSGSSGNIIDISSLMPKTNVSGGI